MTRLTNLTRGCLDGHESAEARADQHNLTGRQRGDPFLELLEHPRNGEGREPRQVEIGA
jgi:hypothetical protein